MGTIDGKADIVLGLLELSAAPAAPGGAWLDEAELARFAAMSGPIRPREFLGGRYLARSMAARTLGVPESRVVIEVEEKGRPFISAPERLFLGLTHTRDYAACALSRSAVGLDLEELGRKGDLRGVESYAFTPRESAAIAGPERERRFFEIWTLKEAYLKLRGMGVQEIGRAPSFELGADGSVRASGGEACGYLRFALGDSIIGALAYDLDAASPGSQARIARAPAIAYDPRFAPPPEREWRALRASGPADS